jgi:hypothetical protein
MVFDVVVNVSHVSDYLDSVWIPPFYIILYGSTIQGTEFNFGLAPYDSVVNGFPLHYQACLNQRGLLAMTRTRPSSKPPAYNWQTINARSLCIPGVRYLWNSPDMPSVENILLWNVGWVLDDVRRRCSFLSFGHKTVDIQTYSCTITLHTTCMILLLQQQQTIRIMAPYWQHARGSLACP